MTTSTIIKLNAGESLTLLVEGSAVVDGNYGKQVQFEGQDVNNKNVTIYLPLESATRQLDRLGLTVDSAKGEVLKIEKVQKDGRTFINIYNTTGPNGRGKVAASPPPPAEPEWLQGQQADEENFVASVKTDKFMSIVVLHRKCFTHALSLATSWEKTGVTASLEGISALTAQLFIAAREAGL